MAMNLIGSKIVKVNGEINSDFKGQVSTKMNVKIKDFSTINKDSFKVKYSFEVDYFDLGKIYLEGLVFFVTDSKNLKVLEKSWKERKINTENYVYITNLVIQKASIKAIEIEEEMGFPIHIRLPKVDLNEKKD